MVGTITHGVWQVREMAQRDYCFYSHLRRICLYIGDIEEVRKATLISISESYQAYGVDKLRNEERSIVIEMRWRQ